MSDQDVERWSNAAAYVLGQLQGEDRDRFESRLAAEPHTQQALADVGAVIEALKSDRDTPVSRDLAPEVVARIRAQEAAAPAPPLRVRFLWAWAAAAAVLLCVGTWLLVRTPLRATAPDEIRGVSGDDMSTGVPEASGRACHWLADKQGEDGAWDVVAYGGRKNVSVAVAGLALQALVSQGEGYTKAARRAALHLQAQQRPNGCIGPAGPASMYNHALATVALLRAHQALHLIELKPCLTRAIAYSTNTQGQAGGWGYRGRRGEPACVAVSAWQLQAMHEAVAQGWANAAPVLARGVGYVQSLVTKGGRVAYATTGVQDTNSVTRDLIGAYCLLLAADGKVESQGRLLLGQAVRAARTAEPPEVVDPFRVYFLAQAATLAGDEPSRVALREALGVLSSHQAATGSGAGSLSAYTTAWGYVGGTVYATAMAALSLQQRL